MRTRESDTLQQSSDGQQHVQPLIKINREIPMWAVGSLIVTMIIHGTILWVSNQRMSEEMVKLSAELRTLTAANQQQMIEREGSRFRFDNMVNRVEALERLIANMSAQSAAARNR